MPYSWALLSVFALGSAQIDSGRRLHIGGTCRRDGWEVLNALPGPAVDHVGNAKDLSTFATDSLEEIYASHVLEHFDYAGEIEDVLREWYRVLKPGGKLFVSVPDLETLAQLFLDKQNLNEEERFLVVRMIFGGHMDPYDYHNAGLSEGILRRFLEVAGFDTVTRVEKFQIFDDTSNLELKGVPISLNVTARKPSSLSSDVVSEHSSAAQTPEDRSSQVRIVDNEPRTTPGSGWDHGYFSGAAYTNCYHRELAPNWLDFAALIKGQRPPRSSQGSAFRYLDLGSGTGFGLCILAAAYPEGSFVGVDFHPSHVAESQWLANALGLSNVRFLEADFLTLSHDTTPLQGPSDSALCFDYVVAHGIATWVSEEVQHAMFSVASAVLRPAGLFYCSYNTYPGWLGRSVFNMLAGLERNLHQPSTPMKALRTAGDKLRALARVSQPLRRQLPHLAAELHEIEAERNNAYLLGEYGSDHWKPLYVADMHSRAQRYKFSYVGSATLPEQFTSLLGEPRNSLLTSEPHPTMREALFDLAINQSFRRDIFVKGPTHLSESQRNHAVSELVFILTARERECDYQVTTSFDVLKLDPDACMFIEAAMTEEPRSFGDLSMAMGYSIDMLLPIVSLLIHHGRIGLQHNVITSEASSMALEVNRRLRNLMQAGHNYGFGRACNRWSPGFSPLQALVLETVEQELDEDTATGLVLMGLGAIDGHLTDAAGQAISDPQRQIEGLKSYLNEFRSLDFPMLTRLGAIPAQA